MPVRIYPFQKEMLAHAAALLALRHQRDRKVLPSLPARFEQSERTGPALEAALKREHAGGFAALDGGRMVAYLIGDWTADSVWGRSGWVRWAGCAYDPAAGVEVVRDLYAALGEQWVNYGVFFHFALVPVTDPAILQAWFSLSFGIEQIHALADLSIRDQTLPEIPDSLEVRKAVAEDRHQLEAISDVIWRTQVQAPVWGVMMPETIRNNREGWGDLVEEEDVTVWMARKGEEVLGVQGFWPAEPAADDLLVPDKCIHLSAAGTRPEARGQGIGTLLANYGMVKAQAAGYQYCEADWRSTNLLASRFWPRQGFRPTVYRLVRRLDQRITWANGAGEG